MKKLLDVGCGNNKVAGAIGIDISGNTKADVIHDLDKLPWPFEDNVFDEIICNDVLEHLEDIPGIMDELHRIGKPNSILRIRVPHFSSHNSYNDVTHKHLFGVFAFDGFCGKNATQSHYLGNHFTMIERNLKFAKLHRLIKLLANIYLERYERYLTFIFPAANIEFVMQIEK